MSFLKLPYWKSPADLPRPSFEVISHKKLSQIFSRTILKVHCIPLYYLCEVKVLQSCLTLCDHMDYTVHEILQTKILEWAAFPFSRESSQLRDQTQVSRIAGKFFTSWATREARMLEWVAYPFSRGSFWPRNWSGVFCIAGGLFTNWAIREALYYLCVLHIYSLLFIHLCNKYFTETLF